MLESDLSPESLASIFKGQDAVISVIGGTGFGDQKSYIDAATKAGVKRFFPSEFGINGQSKAVQQLTPFFAVKQEILDYLVEKEKEGLTWTGLICGILFDWVRIGPSACPATMFVLSSSLTCRKVSGKRVSGLRPDVQPSRYLGRRQHTVEWRERGGPRQGCRLVS